MIGTIVHFVAKPGQCRAAIVTGYGTVPGTLNLQVMADGTHDLDIGYDRPYWVGEIPNGLEVGQWHMAGALQCRSGHTPRSWREHFPYGPV